MQLFQLNLLPDEKAELAPSFWSVSEERCQQEITP